METDYRNADFVFEKLFALLNNYEYLRFKELMEEFNDANQAWFLHFVYRILTGDMEYEVSRNWMVNIDEPESYILISLELMDILDGYLFYYEEVDAHDEERIRWHIHLIEEEENEDE